MHFPNGEPQRVARIALLLAVAAAVGCGSDDPADGGEDADFTLSIHDAPGTMWLGTTTGFSVRVLSDDYAGSVTLSAEGLPDGWVVEWADEVIELDADEPVIVEGTITVASDGTPAPEGGTIVISGTGEPGTRTVELDVTVDDEVRITIPSAVGADGDHWGAVEGGTLRMRVGTPLRIVNGDGTQHRVHTSDAIVGLPHQPASMGFQQSYVGVPGSAGSDAIYCHDHNDDGFTLIVE